MTGPDTLRIGISSCLLGQPVRFDGGHKRDGFLVDTLGPLVEWVPVCPEVELGLGTPRETLRLVRKDDAIRMVQPKSGGDVTDQMRAWAGRRVEALAGERLAGYVLKKDSPSCGMERVRIYSESGTAERGGRGLFAEALIARFPTLPVEEEGRLIGPAAARELRRAGLRLRAAARLLRGPMDRRRPRPVPHGPQADAALALAGDLLRDGPARRRRGRDGPRRARGAVPRALHGRPRTPGHHAQARQRADAHARPLQAAARRRRPRGAARRASRTTGSAWFRSSCPSRSSGTTCAGTRSSTWPGRSISTRTRAN